MYVNIFVFLKVRHQTGTATQVLSVVMRIETQSLCQKTLLQSDFDLYAL